MTAPRFTISLLCCNRLELTRACLTSVLAHSTNCELIITDNGSTDGTQAYLTDFAAKHTTTVRVVRNATNEGFKDPNNHALTLARGEFFVLLNNDMTVCPAWLDKLAEPFQHDPRCAVTGIKDTCTMISDKLIGTKGPQLEYIEGSCLMTPTALARKYGLFPSYLRFIYWEDTDYSLKMRELGYTIHTVDLPINHNKRSQTITKVLSPEAIQGHLAHNTEAMKREWGFYFKRRMLDRRILVRRAGAHGDVLLCTPALRALRDRYPLAHIDVQTKCPAMLAGLDWVGTTTRPLPFYDQVVDLNLAYEKRPEVHVVQAFADALQVKLPARWQLHMTPSLADVAWAERVCRGQRAAVIHPGMSCWPGKNWPTQSFEQLTAALRDKGYLTLSVGDDHSPGCGADVELTGQTTPQQLYALCRQAVLFVGIDSMPQHVASAADTASVVLYGPTNPRVLVRPVPWIVAVQADPKVVPCAGEHGRRKKPVTQAPCDGACMRALTVDHVMKAVGRVEVLKV